MNDTTEVFTFYSPRFQSFSLPSDVIKLMLINNCYPKVHRKLIKTCKYFFFKKPFIPLHNLDCFTNNKKLILEILRVPKSKIWLTGKFVIYPQFYAHVDNAASKIIQKLHRSDIKILRFTHQTLSLDEYIFLVSSNFLEIFDFRNAIIKRKNGEVVSFQNLCEYLTNIKKIYYVFRREENAATTITNLPHFKNIEAFYLKNAPINIETEVINEFLQKHPKTDILLKFSPKNQTTQFYDEYRIQHQELINNIIDAGVTENNYPPLISFSKQKDGTYQTLLTLRDAYLQRYKL